MIDHFPSYGPLPFGLDITVKLRYCTSTAMTGKTNRAVIHLSRGEFAAILEERILSGEWPVGTRLPSERQLAEHYGVSRPVVREALRALSEHGLVEILPGRGSFVRQAQATDAASRLDALYRRRQATPRDLVEARTTLECAAAALAAERATADDLATIEAALRRFDQSQSIVEQARYDLAFHLAIARAAHNPVIETMFGSITTLTFELMLRSLSDPDVARVSVPYHLVIYQAIQEGAVERARTAMAEHLAVASVHYGDDYNRSIESVTPRQFARMLDPGVTLEDLLTGHRCARRASGRGGGS
jgi:GntR family transcriptional repressor for pyruvate dehydrogenase complex